MDSYDFSPSYRCGCRNCSIFKICDDGCPNPDKDAVLPVLNETTAVVTSLHHFHLEAQRQRETKQMMTTFANFAYETCESMKKKVTVEKFTVWLKQLEAFDKVSHCSESTSALLAQRINEISQAGSMEQVFLILSDYWSWYNHYLVEEIVNTFGDQDDQRRLDDFKENFSTFAQNRIGEFSQHEMSLGAAGGDKKRRPLLFKVDKIWDNIHINQLPDIHQNLASILGVNPHTLYFASIRQGCILMEFLIPSSVAQAVFPLSSSQKEALAAASVMQVLCGTHSYKFLASSTPQASCMPTVQLYTIYRISYRRGGGVGTGIFPLRIWKLTFFSIFSSSLVLFSSLFEPKKLSKNSWGSYLHTPMGCVTLHALFFSPPPKNSV